MPIEPVVSAILAKAIADFAVELLTSKGVDPSCVERGTRIYINEVEHLTVIPSNPGVAHDLVGSIGAEQVSVVVAPDIDAAPEPESPRPEPPRPDLDADLDAGPYAGY